MWTPKSTSFYLLTLVWAVAAVFGASDPRNILSGTSMVDLPYTDQPYCQIVPECINGKKNFWVCVITADASKEGGDGEKVLVLRSEDGKNWTQYAPLSLETSSLSNSYAVLAMSPSEGHRLFAFYNFNKDNITTLNGTAIRHDMLGYFMVRASDDCGATWSERYPVPNPVTAVDRGNNWGGKVQMMWTVDQVKNRAPGVSSDAPAMMFAYTKIGEYMVNPPEEGFWITSHNIYDVEDPANATYTALPVGDHGLLPPNGNPRISEEWHILPLLPREGGGYYVVARTTQGFLAATETRDVAANGGFTETHFAQSWITTRTSITFPPLSAAFGPSNGTTTSQILKNPRGPITMRRFPQLNTVYGSDASNILLLFYFNSVNTYADNSRNPYFLASGRAHNGTIYWSQPEVILYDHDDPSDRPGYPDMLWDPRQDTIVMTETNKSAARAHWFSAPLLQGLVQQHTLSTPATTALIASGGPHTTSLPIPTLSFNMSTWHPGDGITAELWITGHSNAMKGETLINADNVTNPKRGFSMVVAEDAGSLSAYFVDSTASNQLVMDDKCGASLQVPGPGPNDSHQVAIVADAGARMLLWVVDGMLCDGGSNVRGWAWMTEVLDDLNGSGVAKLAYNYGGSLEGVRIYDRALSTSELVGNFRAGPPT